MVPNTEAGTALIGGTVEEGDTGTTVLMRGTDTGIGAQGVTSIETLTGTGAGAARGSTGGGRRTEKYYEDRYRERERREGDRDRERETRSSSDARVKEEPRREDRGGEPRREERSDSHRERR